MSEIFGSIWWLLVTLGLLITFHEFGHFWVARKLGVRVLRFSVGFGRPLWSRRGADGTEYAVAAFPLGGYVKMLDEREGPVAADQVDEAFNRKPVGQPHRHRGRRPGLQPGVCRDGVLADVPGGHPGIAAGDRRRVRHRGRGRHRAG